MSNEVSGQSYGLKFNGKNYSLDNRTGLNLSPDGYLSFQNDFEISFDHKASRINSNSNNGLFGYVLRVVNRDNYNIDVLSSAKNGNRGFELNIVLGKLDSIVPIQFPKSSVEKWMQLKIKFNLSEDQIVFYTPDTIYTQKNIGFKKKDDFKILFGANDFKQFKTSDVPSMSIRDIKITEHGKLTYHWPLNNKNTTIASDQILEQKALVKNPDWLNLRHQNWQSTYENEIKGQMMVTNNNENGDIYIVGSNELTIFSALTNRTKKIAYKNFPPFLQHELRPIYNSIDHKIYCYLPQNHDPHVLDINTGVWEKLITIAPKKTITSNSRLSNRFFNRYFNALDNSIYLFGGYGQHEYNNEISKIDIVKNELTPLETNDSIYHPKYLSGLGALQDTIYILGGYGSNSGDQMINPKSYYDLIGYSIKDKTLFKKFEIPHIIDVMCIANTMWIDEKTRDYYALAYEKTIFNGHLQMIKGNLDAPEIEKVGSKIPYQFLDVGSTAGLLYKKQTNQLFAYTTYTTENTETNVKIYSIKYPPNTFVEEVANLEASKEPKNFTTILLTILGFILFGIVLILFKRKNKPSVADSIETTTKKPAKQEEPSIGHKEEVLEGEKTNYQLIFFGGFQIINKKNEDITSLFTPLIKELFLLILLHTFKNDKGISTEKITEVLWYDKSEKSARNNRAVNLARLRTLLSDIDDFELSKKTGYWKCNFENSKTISDYIHFLELTASKTNLTKEKINQIIEITKKGPFLRNAQNEWLDQFKAQVSDSTIDTLTYFGQQCDIKEEADFIIHLADSIFIFDVTNEDAMILKCKAQNVMGKHSKAEETFKKFCKEYSAMYGEEYEHTFTNILKTKN